MSEHQFNYEKMPTKRVTLTKLHEPGNVLENLQQMLHFHKN